MMRAVPGLRLALMAGGAGLAADIGEDARRSSGRSRGACAGRALHPVRRQRREAPPAQGEHDDKGLTRPAQSQKTVLPEARRRRRAAGYGRRLSPVKTRPAACRRRHSEACGLKPRTAAARDGAAASHSTLRRLLVVLIGVAAVWLIVFVVFRITDKRLPSMLALSRDLRDRGLCHPAARRAHEPQDPAAQKRAGLHHDRRRISGRSGQSRADRRLRAAARRLRRGRLDGGRPARTSRAHGS